MTGPVALLPVLPALPQTQPAQAEDAARQFEALLIGQVLRSARGDEGDSSTALMLDVADQEFAKVLAAQGGFGLARLIVKGLETPR
jgi:Rod binding domain-containing protein